MTEVTWQVIVGKDGLLYSVISINYNEIIKLDSYLTPNIKITSSYIHV